MIQRDELTGANDLENMNAENIPGQNDDRWALQEAIEAALQSLNEQERTIIRMRFGLVGSDADMVKC